MLFIKLYSQSCHFPSIQVTEEVVATFIMTDLDFNPLSICNFRVDYHLYDPRIDCRLQGCGYSNGGCFNRFKAEANATACYS